MRHSGRPRTDINILRISLDAPGVLDDIDKKIMDLEDELYPA